MTSRGVICLNVVDPHDAAISFGWGLIMAVAKGAADMQIASNPLIARADVLERVGCQVNRSRAEDWQIFYHLQNQPCIVLVQQTYHLHNGRLFVQPIAGNTYRQAHHGP